MGNDNEVKGEGNQQDYGLRIYDPRLGKFFKRRSINKTISILFTLSFCRNSQIENIDLDCGEPISKVEEWSKTEGYHDYGDYCKVGGRYQKVEEYWVCDKVWGGEYTYRLWYDETAKRAINEKDFSRMSQFLKTLRLSKASF